MKSSIKMMFTVSLMTMTSAAFAEPVCKRCEEVRAYNKEHPSSGFEYYEDYISSDKDHADSDAIKEANSSAAKTHVPQKNAPVK